MELKYSEEEIYLFMFAALRWFGPLSKELEEAIIARTEIRIFRKKQVLARKGKACGYCYFSFQGYVKGFRVFDGEELVEWFMGVKSIIIRPESFHEQHPSEGYIAALEDLVVVELSYENFAWLIENFAEFRVINTKALNHYRNLTEERQTMKGFTGEQNLQRLLTEHPGILKIASNKDVASYLGITREQLARIKKKCGIYPGNKSKTTSITNPFLSPGSKITNPQPWY